MGVDIHMDILHNGEVIKKDIFDGRNSEWFNNLQPDRGWDDEYGLLNICYGYPDETPEDYIKRYEDKRTYFGRHYIKVQDFVEWFWTYRPDKKAGWVTTYDKWRIENKGYIPEDLPTCLYKDDIIEDMHFITYENRWDCSKWLVEYLMGNEIPVDAYIVYCFDC